MKEKRKMCFMTCFFIWPVEKKAAPL